MDKKKVIMSYYVVSVLSVEHSEEHSAALDYSNVYYDEERAVDEARFLANRDGVLQVIVYKWNLHDDGTEEPCDDGYVFSWKEGEEKPSIDMFVKLEMEANDCCEEVVCLSRPEIKAVQKFIKAVGHRGFCWQGGHWTVSDPCATEDEAWDVDMRPFVKELDCGALMSVEKFLHGHLFSWHEGS